MIRFKKSEIQKTAMRITHNSELYADEVESVCLELSKLSESANALGCCLESEISDWWGGSVIVCAVPETFRHSWSF